MSDWTYPVTWEQRTAGMTPEQKVLRAFEWAAGMAHQGENAGSAWDRAMQETLPILREMVAVDVPAAEGEDMIG